MTFHDYLCNAEAGDVEAMLWLSHYYHDKNSYEGTEKSIYWGEMAAEAGSPQGIMITATGYPLLALINEASNVGEYKTAIQYRKKTIKWSKLALERLEVDSKGREILLQKIDESNYGIAASHFFMGKYDEALDYTYGLSAINVTILRGCCFFRLAKTNAEYYEAYNDLKILENAREYNLEISSTSESEQRIFVYGIQFLANLYRTGLPERLTIDINKSASLLYDAFTSLTDEQLKAQLQKEIDHYRKKLFGGYRYIQ